MKSRFVWDSALALAMFASSEIPTLGTTNGLIVITSRTACDSLYRQISSSQLYDADDIKGPGAFSPGDAAMAALLQDYGYSTRLIPEWLLATTLVDPQGLYVGYLAGYYYDSVTPAPAGAPDMIYGGAGGPTKPFDTNNDYATPLVIVSGSGSSFDIPPPNTRGIPIIMGEHSCVADATRNQHSAIYMYGMNGTGSNTGDSSLAGASVRPGLAPVTATVRRMVKSPSVAVNVSKSGSATIRMWLSTGLMLRVATALFTTESVPASSSWLI